MVQTVSNKKYRVFIYNTKTQKVTEELYARKFKAINQMKWVNRIKDDVPIQIVDHDDEYEKILAEGFEKPIGLIAKEKV